MTEDGRKKTTLPPLESETTFYRQQKKTTVNALFSDEGDSFRRFKKISVDVDRKIINHLRRDLAKRMERRIQQVYDPNFADTEDNNADDGQKPPKSRKPSYYEREVTIFEKYSETGDKLNKGRSNKHRMSSSTMKSVKLQDSPLRSGRSRGSIGSPLPQDLTSSSVPRTRNNSQSEDMFGKGTPLPDISGTDSRRASTKGRRKVSMSDPPVTNSDSSRRESATDTQSNEGDQGAAPDGDLANQQEEGVQKPEEVESVQPEVNFRSMVVSPVPTPLMSRPETRERTLLTITETMSQVLNGYVHRRCPPDHKVLRLYVMGGYTDTLTERTVLMQKVYPKLREFCSLYGRDLHIYDLHWGLKDGVADDHQVQDVIGRVIAKCQESIMGLNLLMILGEKYGPTVLPAEIPSEEFDNIVLGAKLFRERQIKFIRTSIADIEATRAERERLRQLEMETASIATTETTVTESAHLGRSESIISHREDMDDETESLHEDSSPIKFRQPSNIARKEQAAIRALRESEDDIPDVSALEQWYTLDENRNPPVYRLQNISTTFKDILRNDGKKRDAAKISWNGVANRIRKVLQTFAPEVVRSHAHRRKYFTSDVEMEIERAMESEYVTSHTLCVIRTFQDVRSHVTDVAAEDYLDTVGLNKNRSVDPPAAKRIDLLREDLVLRRLPLSSINEFSVEWDSQGIRDQGVRDHVVYLERLCKYVLANAKRRLAEYLEDSDDKSWKAELFREVTHHVRFCHERVQKFHGRKDILTLIKSYIRSSSRSPLVLYGKTGSGKSAILSKCAKDVYKWFRGLDQDVRVLVRIVGSTEESTNVRSLLRSLCLQMCHVFGNSHSEVPSDYKGVVNDFAHRLNQATEDRSLLIIIDGVDGLQPDHDGRKMTWLPRELPDYVKIIVSTQPEDRHECLPALKKLLDGKSDSLVEVQDLPQLDAVAMVNHWLRTVGRCLTDHQFDVLVSAFAKCPVPLFLKIAYNETMLWKSYSNPEMCKLADGVKKLGTLRLARLERDHGESLVRRALGYITASRHGLTSNEMEDLLSLDDVVMDEVTNIYHPPARRLPPLLWVRLLEDVSDLLMEFAADRVKTLRWAHSQFHDAAVERYLKQRDKAPSYHKALSEYFRGTWAGRPKPFPGNEKGADRLVATQAYFLEPADSLHDGTDRIYNLRKINELPYHLQHAQMTLELKTEALLNFEWILAKLCGTSLRDLLEEYSSVIQANPDEQELKVMSDTLHLSGRALRQDPRQLASQLVGRLTGVIQRDAPKGPGEKRKLKNIQTMLESIKDSSLPALIPSVECLTPPGGVLFDLLSGHTAQITALTLTSDGTRALTASLDDTLKLWELRTGRVVKTLEGVGAAVTSLRMANNDSVAVTVEGAVIRLWDMRSGQCVMTMEERPDPAVVCVALEGKVLVALHEGTNTFRSWNTETFQKLCEVDSPEEKGVHKDKSIVVAQTVYNEQVLHAFRSGNTATVQHARTGEVLRTLKCNENGSSIAAVAVSREYHVVCCRQQFQPQQEIHVLDLFDSRSGNYMRTVQGCVHDRVLSLQVNLIGSHAVAVSTFEKQQMSDIAVWNLESEDHKHLASHPLTATAAACLDFRFCVTASKGQNALRVWNISGKVNKPAPRPQAQHGVGEILPMQDNPRFCVTKAVNHGPLSVWHAARGKCLVPEVRVERGMTETSDAVVVHNTRLVVLADRGITRPVFQTTIVYDLKAQKYERKLTGCYIAPAPSHEYILLDAERLMGPSETRSHLVVWSLVSGHAVQRIKTNFKEKERKKMEAGASGVALLDCNKPSGEDGGPGTHMTPWDRRAETGSARQRRLEEEADLERQRVEDLKKEKENSIDRFIVSGDQKVLVASFYAHHLCVFDIESQKHTQTLENEHSLLLLHVAAITYDGSHLVHANYDERDKVSYVTLWDCITGEVKRRLKRETNVCALGITHDATRVVIGRAPNQLHIWDPMKSNSLRKARGYDGLRFSVGSKIFLQNDASRAVVFAGDISLWDLDHGIALSVFTPDTRILSCQAILDGQIIVFGLYERQDLIILKLAGKNVPAVPTSGGTELFGEPADAEDFSDEPEEEAEN